MIPSSPQESQGLQWQVEGAKVSVSGAEDAMQKISKQLERLGITPSSPAGKTITISKEDFSKLQASDSSLSIPGDMRRQLVADVQASQSKQPTRDMFVSVLNKPSLLEQFIRDGRVNENDEFGSTLLHVAAVRNEPEAIALLLQAGAGIDAQDDAGETPLYSAAEWGNNEAVKALIKEGANPHLAYYVAVKNNNTAAINALEPYQDIREVLALAAAEGNIQVIDALIENVGILTLLPVLWKANESTDETTKKNLLYAINNVVYHIVTKGYKTDAIRHVIYSLQENGVDLSGILWKAAQEKNDDAINKLLEIGVRLSAPALKDYYKTPGKIEDLRFLLNHIENKENTLFELVLDDPESAEIFAQIVRDVNLNQVVSMAISRYANRLNLSNYRSISEAEEEFLKIIDRISVLGSIDIQEVKRLVQLPDRGKEHAITLVERNENDQDKALCRAVRKNEGDAAIRSWLDKGVNINKALLYAVESFDAKTVASLCKYGAQPDRARDSDGTPVLYVAAARGDVAMIKALVDSGASLKTSLEICALFKREDILGAFVKAGVKRPDEDVIAQLLTAALYNRLMIPVLIDAGWGSWEALLFCAVSEELSGGRVPWVSSAAELAKKSDMGSAIKYAEKQNLPSDVIDRRVAKIKSLYGQ